MDETALLQYIKNYDFENAVFSKPVTEQAEAMTKVLTTAFQQFVPSKTIVVRVSDQPWVKSYTRLLLRKNKTRKPGYAGPIWTLFGLILDHIGPI